VSASLNKAFLPYKSYTFNVFCQFLPNYRFGRMKTIVASVWLAGFVMVIGGLLNYYDDGSDGK